jgi:hypothetical protein
MSDKPATLVDCDGAVFVLFSNVFEDIMEEDDSLENLRYGLKDDNYDYLYKAGDLAEAEQWCNENDWTVSETIYA